MEKTADDKVVANIKENDVVEKIGNHILQLLTRQSKLILRSLVILCIGSDRYTGDALGPLIGSSLLEHGGYTVYGCLDRPVHAGNLVEVIKNIKSCHANPMIIAIDACLGRQAEIGNIEVWEGGLDAGIAVGQRLPRVGDISIVGVVNTGGHFGYVDLQTTPLGMVIKLSKAIAGALFLALDRSDSEAAAGLSDLTGI